MHLNKFKNVQIRFDSEVLYQSYKPESCGRDKYQKV